jgi:hypothetical protein
MHWPPQQTSSAPHWVSAVQGEQVFLIQSGLAGSVHCASVQQSPATHRPLQQTWSVRQGLLSSHVGQHLAPRLQPALLMLPSGMVVRQKMAAPVLTPATDMSRRVASTKQVLSRLAPRNRPGLSWPWRSWRCRGWPP